MKPCVFIVTVLTALCFNGALLQSEMQKKLKPCKGDMWKLVQNNSIPTGHAKLRFKIEKGYDSGTYDAIVACRELVVHGGGSQKMSISKWKASYVEFGIAVPRAGVESDSEDKRNSTCSFELRQNASETSPHKILMECGVRVATVLSRIVPHCSDTTEKGEKLLQYIRVMKDIGTVHIYFRSSANNVVNIKHYCENNPLERFGDSIDRDGVFITLNTFGTHERIYALSFYPDCDRFNATVRKLFMNKENHDCHVSIYAVCQEGKTLVKSMDVDLDKKAMVCQPPKTAYKKTIEQAKLKFRIESDAIVFLLLILICNILLYLLLIPCLVTICVRGVMKAGRRFQKQRDQRGKKKPPKKPPGSPYQPTDRLLEELEYDDGDIYVANESAKQKDKKGGLGQATKKGIRKKMRLTEVPPNEAELTFAPFDSSLHYDSFDEEPLPKPTDVTIDMEPNVNDLIDFQEGSYPVTLNYTAIPKIVQDTSATPSGATPSGGEMVDVGKFSWRSPKHSLAKGHGSESEDSSSIIALRRLSLKEKERDVRDDRRYRDSRTSSGFAKSGDADGQKERKDSGRDDPSKRHEKETEDDQTKKSHRKSEHGLKKSRSGEMRKVPSLEKEIEPQQTDSRKDSSSRRQWDEEIAEHDHKEKSHRQSDHGVKKSAEVSAAPDAPGPSWDQQQREGQPSTSHEAYRKSVRKSEQRESQSSASQVHRKSTTSIGMRDGWEEQEIQREGQFSASHEAHRRSTGADSTKPKRESQPSAGVVDSTRKQSREEQQREDTSSTKRHSHEAIEDDDQTKKEGIMKSDSAVMHDSTRKSSRKRSSGTKHRHEKTENDQKKKAHRKSSHGLKDGARKSSNDTHGHKKDRKKSEGDGEDKHKRKRSSLKEKGVDQELKDTHKDSSGKKHRHEKRASKEERVKSGKSHKGKEGKGHRERSGSERKPKRELPDVRKPYSSLVPHLSPENTQVFVSRFETSPADFASVTKSHGQDASYFQDASDPDKAPKPMIMDDKHPEQSDSQKESPEVKDDLKRKKSRSHSEAQETLTRAKPQRLTIEESHLHKESLGEQELSSTAKYNQGGEKSRHRDSSERVHGHRDSQSGPSDLKMTELKAFTTDEAEKALQYDSFGEEPLPPLASEHDVSINVRAPSIDYPDVETGIPLEVHEMADRGSLSEKIVEWPIEDEYAYAKIQSKKHRESMDQKPEQDQTLKQFDSRDLLAEASSPIPAEIDAGLREVTSPEKPDVDIPPEKQKTPKSHVDKVPSKSGKDKPKSAQKERSGVKQSPSVKKSPGVKQSRSTQETAKTPSPEQPRKAKSFFARLIGGSGSQKKDSPDKQKSSSTKDKQDKGDDKRGKGGDKDSSSKQKPSTKKPGGVKKSHSSQDARRTPTSDKLHKLKERPLSVTSNPAIRPSAPGKEEKGREGSSKARKPKDDKDSQTKKSDKHGSKKSESKVDVRRKAEKDKSRREEKSDHTLKGEGGAAPSSTDHTTTTGERRHSKDKSIAAEGHSDLERAEVLLSPFLLDSSIEPISSPGAMAASDLAPKKLELQQSWIAPSDEDIKAVNDPLTKSTKEDLDLPGPSMASLGNSEKQLEKRGSHSYEDEHSTRKASLKELRKSSLGDNEYKKEEKSDSDIHVAEHGTRKGSLKDHGPTEADLAEHSTKKEEKKISLGDITSQAKKEESFIYSLESDSDSSVAEHGTRKASLKESHKPSLKDVAMEEHKTETSFARKGSLKEHRKSSHDSSVADYGARKASLKDHESRKSSLGEIAPEGHQTSPLRKEPRKSSLGEIAPEGHQTSPVRKESRKSSLGDVEHKTRKGSLKDHESRKSSLGDIVSEGHQTSPVKKGRESRKSSLGDVEHKTRKGSLKDHESRKSSLGDIVSEGHQTSPVKKGRESRKSSLGDVEHKTSSIKKDSLKDHESRKSSLADIASEGHQTSPLRKESRKSTLGDFEHKTGSIKKDSLKDRESDIASEGHQTSPLRRKSTLGDETSSIKKGSLKDRESSLGDIAAEGHQTSPLRKESRRSTLGDVEYKTYSIKKGSLKDREPSLGDIASVRASSARKGSHDSRKSSLEDAAPDYRKRPSSVYSLKEGDISAIEPVMTEKKFRVLGEGTSAETEERESDSDSNSAIEPMYVLSTRKVYERELGSPLDEDLKSDNEGSNVYYTSQYGASSQYESEGGDGDVHLEPKSEDALKKFDSEDYYSKLRVASPSAEIQQSELSSGDETGPAYRVQSVRKRTATSLAGGISRDTTDAVTPSDDHKPVESPSQQESRPSMDKRESLARASISSGEKKSDSQDATKKLSMHSQDDEKPSKPIEGDSGLDKEQKQPKLFSDRLPSKTSLKHEDAKEEAKDPTLDDVSHNIQIPTSSDAVLPLPLISLSQYDTAPSTSDVGVEKSRSQDGSKKSRGRSPSAKGKGKGKADGSASKQKSISSTKDKQKSPKADSGVKKSRSRDAVKKGSPSAKDKKNTPTTIVSSPDISGTLLHPEASQKSLSQKDTAESPAKQKSSPAVLKGRPKSPVQSKNEKSSGVKKSRSQDGSRKSKGSPSVKDKKEAAESELGPDISPKVSKKSLSQKDTASPAKQKSSPVIKGKQPEKSSDMKKSLSQDVTKKSEGGSPSAEDKKEVLTPARSELGPDISPVASQKSLKNPDVSPSKKKSKSSPTFDKKKSPVESKKLSRSKSGSPSVKDKKTLPIPDGGSAVDIENSPSSKRKATSEQQLSPAVKDKAAGKNAAKKSRSQDSPKQKTPEKSRSGDKKEKQSSSVRNLSPTPDEAPKSPKKKGFFARLLQSRSPSPSVSPEKESPNKQKKTKSSEKGSPSKQKKKEDPKKQSSPSPQKKTPPTPADEDAGPPKSPQKSPSSRKSKDSVSKQKFSISSNKISSKLKKNKNQSPPDDKDGDQPVGDQPDLTDFSSLKKKLDSAYMHKPGTVSPSKILQWRANIVVGSTPPNQSISSQTFDEAEGDVQSKSSDSVEFGDVQQNLSPTVSRFFDKSDGAQSGMDTRMPIHLSTSSSSLDNKFMKLGGPADEEPMEISLQSPRDVPEGQPSKVVIPQEHTSSGGGPDLFDTVPQSLADEDEPDTTPAIMAQLHPQALQSSSSSSSSSLPEEKLLRDLSKRNETSSVILHMREDSAFEPHFPAIQESTSKQESEQQRRSSIEIPSRQTSGPAPGLSYSSSSPSLKDTASRATSKSYEDLTDQQRSSQRQHRRASTTGRKESARPARFSGTRSYYTAHRRHATMQSRREMHAQERSHATFRRPLSIQHLPDPSSSDSQLDTDPIDTPHYYPHGWQQTGRPQWSMQALRSLSPQSPATPPRYDSSAKEWQESDHTSSPDPGVPATVSVSTSNSSPKLNPYWQTHPISATPPAPPLPPPSTSATRASPRRHQLEGLEGEYFYDLDDEYYIL